jgi:hypothetical protein
VVVVVATQQRAAGLLDLGDGGVEVAVAMAEEPKWSRPSCCPSLAWARLIPADPTKWA